jgi:DNA-directed RNA polymerase subunit RPC12/RpoP
MLSCAKCEFQITPMMKWAIARNSCPSCGSKVMSDEDIFDIKKMSKKIEDLDSLSKLRELSVDNGNLCDSLISELSILFNFSLRRDTEISSVQIRMSKKRQHEAESSSDDDDIINDEAEIRKQVEREMGIDNEEEEGEGKDDNEDEDEDDRVSRLKALHKKAQKAY